MIYWIVCTQKRDLFGTFLKDVGFGIPDYDETPWRGFFIFARIGKEITDLIPEDRLMTYNAAALGTVARQNWALCQLMAEEKGVLCIPASPFFSENSQQDENARDPISDQFVRIAFCKTNDTIQNAAEALMKISESLHSITSNLT